MLSGRFLFDFTVYGRRSVSSCRIRTQYRMIYCFYDAFSNPHNTQHCRLRSASGYFLTEASDGFKSNVVSNVSRIIQFNDSVLDTHKICSDMDRARKESLCAPNKFTDSDHLWQNHLLQQRNAGYFA